MTAKKQPISNTSAAVDVDTYLQILETCRPFYSFEMKGGAAVGVDPFVLSPRLDDALRERASSSSSSSSSDSQGSSKENHNVSANGCCCERQYIFLTLLSCRSSNSFCYLFARRYLLRTTTTWWKTTFHCHRQREHTLCRCVETVVLKRVCLLPDARQGMCDSMMPLEIQTRHTRPGSKCGCTRAYIYIKNEW